MFKDKLIHVIICVLLTWKLELDLARPHLPALHSLPSHHMVGFSTAGAIPDSGPWQQHG